MPHAATVQNMADFDHSGCFVQLVCFLFLLCGKALSQVLQKFSKNATEIRMVKLIEFQIKYL